MKLLCVSHPCATAANQEFFERVRVAGGCDVTLVVPARWRSEYGELVAERWSGFSGRLVPLPVIGRGNIPLHVYAASLASIVRSERPDVVYVHHEPYALATAQAFRANGRCGRAPIGFYSAQNLLKRYPWPFSALERRVYRQASFAFPVSRAVERVLRAKGYRGRAEVLPLAVTPRPLTERRAPNGSLTLGFVGRLAHEKGADILLDALARLPATVRAVIAGDGGLADALRRRAASLGVGDRVRWLGYVPHAEVGAIYPTFDALIVPSRSVPGWREQFGRVVVEALAAGVPVLASDSGELPELVAATGGGWTFPEGDAAALAALVAELLDAPVSLVERGRRGRAAVEERFAMETVAARFAAVVRECAEGVAA